MSAMDKEQLQKIPVSFYRNMKDSLCEPLTVERVLNGIRSNFYESQIKKIRLLREDGRKQEADELKENLHAVTFCATFDKRRKSSFYSGYNNLMVIDIDKLDSSELERVQNCLKENPYVACYWMSPSGTGWKGLVSLNYLNDSPQIDVVDKHHWAFNKLEELFLKNSYIQLDKSGKDITRLCFMSWYPELILKDQFLQFDVDLKEMEKARKKKKAIGEVEITVQSSGEPIQWNMIDGQKQDDRSGNVYDRRLVERIYKYLEGRNESLTSSYDDWVKVAFAIAHTFHSVYGRKIFLKLCRLDGASHDEARSERLIYDAYTTQEKRCDFSTIVYLAKGKGFIR